MQRRAVATKTGEVIKRVYMDDVTGDVKEIKYERFDYIFSHVGDKVELIFYPEGFNVPRHLAYNDEFMFDEFTFPEMETVLNQRKFKLVDGVAVPRDISVTLSDLQTTINTSGKRAIRNFYNYALANDWEYFCTFTFADATVRQDKDLLYKTWNQWLYMLRKSNKDVKAISVYERFEKGGFHLHGLLTDCDLNLKPARSANTGKYLYSEFGNQIFNAADWKHGFSTIVCINPDSVNAQVVNYLSKYMTKDSPAPYGCKRYFHTTNLNYRNTYCGRFAKAELPDDKDLPFEQMIKLRNSDKFSLPKAVLQFDLREVKKKGSIVVYRNY